MASKIVERDCNLRACVHDGGFGGNDNKNQKNTLAEKMPNDASRIPKTYSYIYYTTYIYVETYTQPRAEILSDIVIKNENPFDLLLFSPLLLTWRALLPLQ